MPTSPFVVRVHLEVVLRQNDEAYQNGSDKKKINEEGIALMGSYDLPLYPTQKSIRLHIGPQQLFLGLLRLWNMMQESAA